MTITVRYSKGLVQNLKEYPVWNASNTLLMDDSPDKCGVAKNAPSAPTEWTRNNTGNNNNDDEINARQQRLFLEQLVQHWNEMSCPTNLGDD
jgi:hypothetical protein